MPTPAPDGGRYNIPVQTTINRQIKTELELHALRGGVKVAAVVRWAVVAWLDAHPIGPRIGPPEQPSMLEE